MRLRGRWRPGRKAIRLISLDVLRGLTVAGMILVNSAAAMKYGAEADVAPILLHVGWDGLTLADLVSPGFLTMVGIAIPFSMRDASFDSAQRRSEEHTSELQSLMRNSYAVFCLKNTKK